MSVNARLLVPPILRQKCTETRGLSSEFACSFQPVVNGHIIIWKGKDTGYFWTFDESGKFFLYEHNGTVDARVKFVHQFDPQLYSVNSVAYYPTSDKYHGIVVAVTNVAGLGGSYIAYFSLVTNRLVKSFSVSLPITCLYNVYDGTTPCSTFDSLCKQFRTGWNDILVIGCQRGLAYVTRLDVGELVEDEMLYENQRAGNGPVEEPPQVRARHMIPLTKLFHGDKMFTYQTDEGRQICLDKDQVNVSALHYLEKSKCVIIGFNFGGIVFVSLATSKINTFYYGDGIVQFFAVQEPEEDPRPILYYWTCLHNTNKGTMMILCNINFPKDEANTKDPSEYTYLEPVAYPVLRWAPDDCDQMLSVRTLQVERSIARDDTADRYSMLRTSPIDTSLMLMVWQQKIDNGFRVQGSFFDLNAFYAKRLSGRVVADDTAAKQYAFLSRFFSERIYDEPAMDAFGLTALRYPSPAFLKKSIDQLFYPSANFITFNLLFTDRLMQMKVQPLQLQLIGDLADNIVNYFDEPTDPSKWICALGLANSAPSANINEERACLLRVLVHTFLPGILRLVGASAKNKENLRFIQRWIWREIELTKAKFDELCSSMFAGSSTGMSPEACAYVHQASAFFRRACSVIEALCNEVDAFDSEEDVEWKSSLALQYKASRQVEMFSVGITFGLCHNLLPLKDDSFRIHVKCVMSLKGKLTRANRNGTKLKIYTLVSEIIEQNKDEYLWNGQNAEEWFPPPDFTHLLPILLLMNMTEEKKIVLLGYYFLEFDSVSALMDDVVPTELFNKCVSVFVPNHVSSLLQAQIHQMWFDDNKASTANYRPPSSSVVSSTAESTYGSVEKELYHLPLTTKQEILHVKSEYMKLEHGIHKFNRDMLKKRRYNLLVEPPLPAGPEPEFVGKCREEIARIQKQFPWLSLKIEPFPESIIQKFRNRIALEKREEQEKIVHVAARIPDAEHVSSKSRKRRLNPLASVNESVADESDVFEELPLTIATPAKRQRPIFSSVATATPTSAKVWSRINRVVQTPIALVEPDTLRSPPRNAQPPRTPVSILKSNKKKTEGGARSKLRFQNAFQTEHIPTRSELLMEETRNGSFSTFGNAESPTSPVSRPSAPPEVPTTPVKVCEPPVRKSPKTPTKSPRKATAAAVVAPVDSVHRMVTRSKSPRKFV